MEFGVVLQTNPPAKRVIETMQRAEEMGFGYGWTWDSHVLWQEPFVIYSQILAATSELTVGPMVTNPGTRDWSVLASLFATLNDMYGNRTVCGIGRGDSARRVIGQSPMSLATLSAAMTVIKGLAEGREVGNHVADLVARYGTHGPVPRALTDYIKGREGYDYAHHGKADNPSVDFVPDEIVDRFCLVGPAAAHVDRLRELAGAGADQFALYLMHDQEDATLAAYGDQIIPALA